MLTRMARVLPVAALLLAACGCIEATQVITLNPDGTARVEYDVLTPPAAIQWGGGGGGLSDDGKPEKGKKPTLDDKKRQAVASLLTARPDRSGKGGKVAAWKDVKAEWARDGRLHVKATAYFEKPEDMLDFGYAVEYHLKREEGGGLKFVVRKKPDIGGDGPGGKPAAKEPPPDFARMTDKEWNDFLLGVRVEYQDSKPMMKMLFADMKVKTVVRLPGQVSELENFKKDGPRAASREVEGNAVLAGLDKLFAQNNDALKTRFRKIKVWSKGPGPLLQEVWPDASLTVAKPTGAQFDYKKEVAAALAAYPELRKEYRISAKRLLSGEKPPEKEPKD